MDENIFTKPLQFVHKHAAKIGAAASSVLLAVGAYVLLNQGGGGNLVPGWGFNDKYIPTLSADPPYSNSPDVAVSSVRLAWVDLEPSLGNYNFSAVDAHVNTALAAGRTPVVGILWKRLGTNAATPSWALQSQYQPITGTVNYANAGIQQAQTNLISALVSHANGQGWQGKVIFVATTGVDGEAQPEGGGGGCTAPYNSLEENYWTGGLSFGAWMNYMKHIVDAWSTADAADNYHKLAVISAEYCAERSHRTELWDYIQDTYPGKKWGIYSAGLSNGVYWHTYGLPHDQVLDKPLPLDTEPPYDPRDPQDIMRLACKSVICITEHGDYNVGGYPNNYNNEASVWNWAYASLHLYSFGHGGLKQWVDHTAWGGAADPWADEVIAFYKKYAGHAPTESEWAFVVLHKDSCDTDGCDSYEEKTRALNFGYGLQQYDIGADGTCPAGKSFTYERTSPYWQEYVKAALAPGYCLYFDFDSDFLADGDYSYVDIYVNVKTGPAYAGRKYRVEWVNNQGQVVSSSEVDLGQGFPDTAYRTLYARMDNVRVGHMLWRDAGRNINMDFRIKNTGPANIYPHRIEIYRPLSTTPTPTPTPTHTPTKTPTPTPYPDTPTPTPTPYLGGGKAIARKLREAKATLVQAGIAIEETRNEGDHTIFHIYRR